MAQHGYWSRVAEGRLNRRRMLATVGAGSGAAAFMAACGGDKQEGGGTGRDLPSGQTAATAAAGGTGPKKGGMLRTAAGPLGAELDPHKTNTP